MQLFQFKLNEYLAWKPVGMFATT